jgi:hypothetical protein
MLIGSIRQGLGPVPYAWRGCDEVSAHLAAKEEVSSSKRPCAGRREDTARTSSGALEPRHLLVVDDYHLISTLSEVFRGWFFGTKKLFVLAI